MSHITLTEEQAQVVQESSQPVEVHDCGGRVVARLTLLTAEIREETNRVFASGEEQYPSERIERLSYQFDESDDHDSLDPKSVETTIQRLFDSQDP